MGTTSVTAQPWTTFGSSSCMEGLLADTPLTIFRTRRSSGRLEIWFVKGQKWARIGVVQPWMGTDGVTSESLSGSLTTEMFQRKLLTTSTRFWIPYHAAETLTASRDAFVVLVRMKRSLLWLLLAATLVIAFLLYRSSSRSNLNVEPHAGEVIEKAKER